MYYLKLNKTLYFKNLITFRGCHVISKVNSNAAILSRESAEISKIPNGIRIASIENYSPISQISVLIKAGSRYEEYYNLGIVHFLRSCAVLSTVGRSAFSITRDLELTGSKLSVSSTRDDIIYTVHCKRDEVDRSFPLLDAVINRPAYKPWELETVSPKMHLDMALCKSNPELLLSESLHKAAFRGGLSNSIFSLPHMIRKFDGETLRDFLNLHFTAPRTSFIGLGIDHEHLYNSVMKFFDIKDSSSYKEMASDYHDGEIRMEADFPFTHVAIVAEGTGYSNLKNSLCFGVMQCIIGTGLYSNFYSKFSKIGECLSKLIDNPFGYSAININYHDKGIFGVYITGHPNNMFVIVRTVLQQIRKMLSKVSENDFQVAKHKLKALIHQERENSRELLWNLAIEASYLGRFTDIKELDKAIDSLKIEEVALIARELLKKTPSMAAVGPLHNTPYLKELSSI